MLRGVSNFLFGYSSTPESTECQEIDLKTQVTEEDWILVETENKVAPPTETNPTAAAVVETSSNNSESEDTVLITSLVSENDDPDSSQNETLALFHLDTDSDESPLPHSPEFFCFVSGCTSDSWIMDPPACFTASQDGSSEASVLHTPMENLLIEHPSMSVYDSYSRTIFFIQDNVNTDNEGNDESQNELEEERRPSTPFEEVSLPIVPINRPSNAARLIPCPQNTSQTYRMMLQRQTYEQTRYLNKKSLNRSNKLHEYSHLGKHQRHRARYQCPSGRMNGRFGQRRAY